MVWWEGAKLSKAGAAVYSYSINMASRAESPLRGDKCLHSEWDAGGDLVSWVPQPNDLTFDQDTSG